MPEWSGLTKILKLNLAPEYWEIQALNGSRFPKNNAGMPEWSNGAGLGPASLVLT